MKRTMIGYDFSSKYENAAFSLIRMCFYHDIGVIEAVFGKKTESIIADIEPISAIITELRGAIEFGISITDELCRYNTCPNNILSNTERNRMHLLAGLFACGEEETALDYCQTLLYRAGGV